MMITAGDLDDVADLLRMAAKAIRYFEKVNAAHNCNDCGREPCEYVPDPGQLTRINCPHWERKR